MPLILLPCFRTDIPKRIRASVSACVRLKYTVNLTNQTDYLFAVANVVIWGFAENAVGMIVGNISTLRPLFRSLLDHTVRKPGYGSRSRGGPSKLASSYELSQNGKSGNNFTTTLSEVRDGHGTRRNSQLSDDDSRKLIFQGHDNRDILVSRQINIAYD